jgi:hypothetical protein
MSDQHDRPPRRLLLTMHAEVGKTLEYEKQRGIRYQTVPDPWKSSVVLVWNMILYLGFWEDYRKINDAKDKDYFPLLCQIA